MQPCLVSLLIVRQPVFFATSKWFWHTICHHVKPPFPSFPFFFPKAGNHHIMRGMWSGLQKNGETEKSHLVSIKLSPVYRSSLDTFWVLFLLYVHVWVSVTLSVICGGKRAGSASCLADWQQSRADESEHPLLLWTSVSGNQRKKRSPSRS